MVKRLFKTIYQKPWWEVFFLYGLMLVLTVGLGWAQAFISWLGGFVLFLVALAFMYLPTEWLRYHEENPQDYGIAKGSILQSWKHASIIAILVLLPYTFAYHYWQTWQEREFEWNSAALSKWPEELEGYPSVRTLKQGEVRWYSQRKNMYWQWRLKNKEKNFTLKLHIDADRKLRWVGRSKKIKIQKIAPGTFLVKGPRTGYLQAKTETQHVRTQFWVDGHPLAQTRLYVGPFMQNVTERSFHRGFGWIFYLFLTQLFLVAIPEEIFYRGYLQTRLDQLVGEDQPWWGVAFNFKSAIVCSVLFAIAHIATIPNITRLAVFFPSLLFAWMRRAYGNTLTPAIFHALCNVWVHLLWGFYQGSVA